MASTSFLFSLRVIVSMSIAWVDKYAPKSLSEIVGQNNALEEIRVWAEAWEKGKKQKPLLLVGPVGTGKTATVRALANDFNWELLEMNASDVRSASNIRRIAGSAAASLSFSGKRRLIVFDEVEGIYAQDRGALNAIKEIIRQNNCPLILIANDEWNKKISSLRSECKVVHFKKIHHATIAKRLKQILLKEKRKVDERLIDLIARNSSGDLRAAINDLQTLVEGEEKPTPDDYEIIGSRNREANVYSVVQIILKSMSFDHPRQALQQLNEDPSFMIKWIEENIPKEYKKPEDLYNAMNRLSRADVFLGRVSNQQAYSFWRFASDLMSAGVALAKKEKYHEFVKYSFPSSIKLLSASKKDREILKSISFKIAKKCHVSSKTAAVDYLPMVREVMKKYPESFAKFFGFEDEELKFLGAKVKK